MVKERIHHTSSHFLFHKMLCVYIYNLFQKSSAKMFYTNLNLIFLTLKFFLSINLGSLFLGVIYDRL